MYLYVIAVLSILWSLYLYGTSTFDYWKKRGLRYDKPWPFIGTTGGIFAQTISLTDYFTGLYRQYPQEKFVGYFFSRRPALVLRDPELIKHVMATDFQHFYSRALNPSKTVIEPVMKNLFSVDGDTWKLLRQRMTPAFTSGKLKAMFPLIVERTEKLKAIAASSAEKGAEVDVRDLMARYTTDFIGACGFGIDADSLNDEDSMFRKLGKRIFTFNTRDTIVGLLKWTAPDLFRSLTFFAPEVERNTVTLVKAIMEKRDYKPVGRNDFIDLLLELKQKGRIVGESIEKRNADGTPQQAELELDLLLMSAQVFVFFAAGFETSSSASSFTLHQLAFHPEAQRKCQEEIDEVLSRYDNKLCYEAVKEMKYLEMCFSEGMRIFPSLGFVLRECVKKYQFPYTNMSIDEGVTIAIPIQGLHTDPKYFEEPEKFKPERFSPENIKNIQNFTYIPFGQGPRACIGERLGLMQSLAGLAALLSQYSVAPSKNTLRKPITDPTSTVVQSIKGGIPLALTYRKKNQ